MSLETVIQENTAAVRDLIAALAKGAPAKAPLVEKQAAEAPAKTAEKPATTAKAAPVKAAPAKAAAPTITFDSVQKEAVDFVAAHGREKLVEILEALDVPEAPIAGTDKLVRKVGNVKNDPEMLAKISAALKAASAEAEV